MGDRRPSLIDQMALAAALEEDLDLSSGDEEEEESGSIDDDDLLGGPSEAFTSDAIDEVNEEDLELSFDEEQAIRAAEELRAHNRTSSLTMGTDFEDPSHSGTNSEGLDDFFLEEPVSMPFSLRTSNRDATGGDESQVSAFNMSSVSDKWDVEDPNANLEPEFPSEGGFHFRHASDASFHSAPAGTRQEPPSPVPGGAAVRRASHSIERPSIKITLAGGATPLDGDGDNRMGNSTSSPSVSGGLLPRFSRLSSLSHRRHMSRGDSASMGGSVSIENPLDPQSSSAEWGNVAAAVGGQPAGNPPSRHIKFAVEDTVLVLLTLLNVTNVEDPRDTFTVAPVNKYGFPQGEGRSDAEKSGPYTFVLATVKHVHFDEDDRYYTVVRADTGTEQRADSGWIEPLNDPAGIEAASQAAKLTVRSAQDKPVEAAEESGYLQDVWECLLDSASWPRDFVKSTLMPWYMMQKNKASQMLYGDAPFACRIHVTGINFLVFCSTLFLFLEVINLAFLPATYDREFAIVGATIWFILVLELIFEIAIRPSGYIGLVKSDRAFAPSTARHINGFHIFFETIALATFIPEFRCLGSGICFRDSKFSRVTSALESVAGWSHADAARGQFIIGLTVLRIFGLIRHWKQMFINNTLFPSKREGLDKWLIPGAKGSNDTTRRNSTKKHDDDIDSIVWHPEETAAELTNSEDDRRLQNAGTIGTALMVVNSHRALILLASIVLVLPMLVTLTQQNLVSYKMVDLLQAHNLAAPSSSEDDCAYLEASVQAWLRSAAAPQPTSLLDNVVDTYILWAQLLPVRCDFQRDDGVITICDGQMNDDWIRVSSSSCSIWDDSSPSSPSDASEAYFAEQLNLRFEGIRELGREDSVNGLTGFETRVFVNDNPTIALVNMGQLFVLLGILLIGLYGLNALRGEAIRLVLDPLQRMLKIVLRYAENPLSQDVKSGSNIKKDGPDGTDVEGEEIGNYETEQLINAITKIADLLRKCWGVAGAGIISSNLARTKDGETVVFNPTVPGKRVYALFGFVAINGFSELLRALDRDVMILINDVAKVVHDEVYRWALGDHGQCNKNLGAAFLMVFRIGDFSEVQKKKQVATEKLFRENAKSTTKRSANLRKRLTSARTGGRRTPYAGRKIGRHDVDGQLQLASLPGIQAFTDRALLGMLKSFAGVHRDKQLTTVWKNDFRLSAGVSAYQVDIIYGMDAGWAVEGAVGSEYKIDATYLSPHVNMASRMMSATKQYGVTILLSKAVEELLSRTCRKKLRHLDTVYVKGSKVKQEIFTYDARYQGVDFFLLERTPEQADMDAESYHNSIWDHDRDLLAMRQHVSEKFLETFHLGVKQYLSGKWEEAHRTLELADDLMMENVLNDGYLEYDMEEIEGRIFDKNDQSEEIVRIR
eukprot:CAMPEP_0176166240 /NCGR_PEP_ID=MMETSP0120_2-20121206/85020_1 /TAXON_ID=160619 /ORGANISM="Kryptoperidinium foliaceum, Strain CCMP 1326" /LENGTH=1393 /DNA_ID=CAMNT_0017503773 /DNA_START=61 /DNA_END=4240 /DNA_ORIENTATION=-